MSDLDCSIVTPAQKVFEGKISYISAPGKIGEFGVLPEHENFITTLDIGIVKIKNHDEETKEFLIVGGYFEVTENKIIIIADEVYTKDDIDKEKAAEKYDKYKNALSSLDFNDSSYTKVKHKYDKYSNMMKFIS